MSPNEILFAPQDDRDYYTPADIKYISAQQPIPFDEVPAYLVGGFAPNLTPPNLWCGWRLGEEKLARVAQEKLPGSITYDDFTGEIHYIETLGNGRLESVIRQACQIPEEYAHLLRIATAVRPGTDRPRRDIDAVLSVGSTDAGVMPQDVWERVGHIFADDAEPEFHLDSWRWFWAYTPPEDEDADEEVLTDFVPHKPVVSAVASA
ncbi:hypothetical protein K488DRAFT_90432 [Vararia minispora EC-137]|uniref:Uncharacterized protein n=1 Tax=Vararia minispora EC-137 TaxID=1314806 RepID=A0ACB8Q7Q6_9AGAM|nr:hypothetical protein K488DRAFT_90432 [Vararia minispora EC-137]